MKRHLGLTFLLVGPVLLVASVPREDDPHAQQMARVARALLLYAEDNGDRFPSQGPAGPNRVERTTISVPAGWSRSINATTAAEDRLAWANTFRPYLAELADLAIEGAPEYRKRGWDYVAPLQPPIPVAMTFNGLLTLYQRAGVQNPNLVPLVWTGNGRSNSLGMAWSSPYLRCVNLFPCVFDPSKARHSPSRKGQNGAVMPPTGNGHAFAKGFYFIRVDGSLLTIKPKGGMPTDLNSDPFCEYSGDKPTQYWGDGEYAPSFRPDRTGNSLSGG